MEELENEEEEMRSFTLGIMSLHGKGPRNPRVKEILNKAFHIPTVSSIFILN